MKLSKVKEVVPVIPNNNDTPNKKKPEAKAPSIKYLRPASDDFKESFLVEAKTYKDRKDIGSQKQRSEKEQQPTRERGSAGLSIRDQQRKAAMERRAKKSGAKTPSASELLKKKTTKAVSPGYKQQKASEYTRTERQKLQRTGDRIIKDIRKGKNKPASDYEK